MLVVEVMMVICLNTPGHWVTVGDFHGRAPDHRRVGCTNIPITDNQQMDDSGQVPSFAGCLDTQGFFTAKKFWDEHHDKFPNYHFNGWSCRIGNKKLDHGDKA